MLFTARLQELDTLDLISREDLSSGYVSNLKRQVKRMGQISVTFKMDHFDYGPDFQEAHQSRLLWLSVPPTLSTVDCCSTCFMQTWSLIIHLISLESFL